jgi:hypothetical protein
MKVFIDDIRKPSQKHATPDWILCKNYVDFQNVIDSLLDAQKTWLTEVSFDYMLNDEKYGDDCFKYLGEVCVRYGLPMPKIYVHSEYPGADKIFINLAKKFEEKIGEPIPVKVIY